MMNVVSIYRTICDIIRAGSSIILLPVPDPFPPPLSAGCRLRVIPRNANTVKQATDNGSLRKIFNLTHMRFWHTHGSLNIKAGLQP